jgi:hypothetical protein
MVKRGRVSSAETDLAVIGLSAKIERVHRPEPPYELTDVQAVVWRRVVDDLPADWFTDKHAGLLKQYCRHEAQADRIAQLIEQEMLKPELDLANYDKLTAMQEREGRALSSLATRMRLTQQALYDKSKKAGNFKVSKPWEA